MGILTKPAVPVAWKGEYPKVIYAWTGRSWYQITCREGTLPLSALRNRAYDLTVITNRSNFRWRSEDLGALYQYATMWGYGWMGQIVLSRTTLY